MKHKAIWIPLSSGASIFQSCNIPAVSESKRCQRCEGKEGGNKTTTTSRAEPLRFNLKVPEGRFC